MPRLGYKTTIWGEIELDVNQIPDVIRMLMNGAVPNDICNHFEVSGEPNLETEENVNLQDNKGFSTIEVRDDKGNIIWSNGKD